MSTQPNVQLSKLQLYCYLLHAQIGIAFLLIPHVLGEEAGHDGWISVIIAGIFIQLLGFLYYYIIKNYPNKTFYDVTQIVFGKTLGKIINLFLITYYFCYSVIVTAKCASILNLWIYYRTPTWVIMGLFIFVGYFIVHSELKIIGRFLVISTVFILTIVFFLSWAIKDLNYLYILPIGESGIMKILKSTYNGTIAFAGFETFLFVHSFTNLTPKKRVSIFSLAIWTVSSLYLIATLICFMYFPNSARNVENAVVYLLVPMQFTLVERVEVFFLAGWTVIMATSFICFLYICCLGIMKWRKTQSHINYVMPISVGIFILAILTQMFVSNTFWKTVTTIQEYCTYTIILLLPLLVCCTIFFQNRRNKGVTSHES